MLNRTLEPELMDTAKDAVEYDTMDHSIVNAQFVADLLTALTDWSLQRPVNAPMQTATLQILDLGAGTAQIPIELARHAPNVHITAIDAAKGMLDVARKNIAAAGLADRVEVVLADAKCLAATRSGARFHSASFPIVISNSIVHHIADPKTILTEAIRVTAHGGMLFHRDLARPTDEAQLQHLVETYADGATPYQRKLFADSLRAALSLEEMRDLVGTKGFAPDTVQMTSDRHWTWTATKNC